MNDVLSAQETRRLAMQPAHYRAYLATTAISYIGFFLANDCIGEGRPNDLLKAQEYLRLLVSESVQDKLSNAGSARE